MRHATILVAILAFVPLASATAQVPVRPGARVRVTGHFCQPIYSNCVGGWPEHRVGTFVAWKSDTLVMESRGDTLAVPPDFVTKLEVSAGRRRPSSQGAAIGAAVGGGFLLYARGTAAAGALGAGLGALLGRSPSARKSAGTGFLLGAVVGAVIGLVSYGECESQGAFSCLGPDGPEIYALGGAIIGGLGGLVVGALIGSATETERWEEVPLDRLRVSLGPQRDGRFGLGASLRF